jgi:hypothetical protein
MVMKFRIKRKIIQIKEDVLGLGPVGTGGGFFAGLAPARGGVAAAGDGLPEAGPRFARGFEAAPALGGKRELSSSLLLSSRGCGACASEILSQAPRREVAKGALTLALGTRGEGGAGELAGVTGADATARTTGLTAAGVGEGVGVEGFGRGASLFSRSLQTQKRYKRR